MSELTLSDSFFWWCEGSTYVSQGGLVYHPALCKVVKCSYIRILPGSYWWSVLASVGTMLSCGMRWLYTTGRHAHRCHGDSSPHCLISIFMWSQFEAESNRSALCTTLWAFGSWVDSHRFLVLSVHADGLRLLQTDGHADRWTGGGVFSSLWCFAIVASPQQHITSHMYVGTDQ